MGKPLDKILCEGKFYRYVVACMHNCPRPHYCREFWRFFDAKGITPAEYYNEDGIGDRVMRRVVFDCDRCGKRDIPEVFGMYNSQGEGEEFRLGEPERSEAMAAVGFAVPEVQRLTFVLLKELEAVCGWQHYCKRCFHALADGLSKILTPTFPWGKKPGQKKKGAEPAKAPAPATGAAGDVPAPAPEPSAAGESPPGGKGAAAPEKDAGGGKGGVEGRRKPGRPKKAVAAGSGLPLKR